MIIFTIVYPKNERLVEGASDAIYKRFGTFVLRNSRRVVQYCAVTQTGDVKFLRYDNDFTPLSLVGPAEIYRLVRNRNKNVPWTTEEIGNYGISTEDIVENYTLGRPNSNLVKEDSLNFGLCSICVLGKPNISIESGNNSLRVGTRPYYENLASNYFKERGIEVKVRTDWDGEEEGMIECGLADLVVCSVESGETSKQNQLIVYDKIMDSRAIWIRNLRV